MEGTMLKIGEIAAVYNVSVKSLRLYEKKGIIMPAYVDPSTGYRYYSVDQINQIRVLLELKALGFSLKEIKAVLSGKSGEDSFREILFQKRMAWQDAASVAEFKVKAIDNIAANLEQTNKLSAMQEMTEEERAWLLSKLVCVEDIAARGPLNEAIWL